MPLLAWARSLLFPASRQDLTVDGSVRALSVPQGTYAGRLKMENGPIRTTYDGTAPVGGATGDLWFDGDQDHYTVAELVKMQFIRDGSVNGTVHATFYRRNQDS